MILFFQCLHLLRVNIHIVSGKSQANGRKGYFSAANDHQRDSKGKAKLVMVRNAIVDAVHTVVPQGGAEYCLQ